MVTSRRKRVWIVAAASVALVMVVGGLVLFKPWLLFVDVRVNDDIPVAAPLLSPEPSVSPPAGEPTPSGPPPVEPETAVQIAEGSLISHEHATTGTVRIINQPDGTRVLTLENLDTTNGPDVHVWLSAADVVEGTDGWYTAGSADYFDLGLIKGNQGNQVYEIPAEVDLAQYKSVDLWCVQFAVSFGAAQLNF
jgi:Electron transfer DM13